MEYVAAVLGIAAVVWLALVLARGGLVAGCIAVLLAGCCLGYPLFRVPMQPIPLTLDRALWAVLLIQYVVWRLAGLGGPQTTGFLRLHPPGFRRPAYRKRLDA